MTDDRALRPPGPPHERRSAQMDAEQMAVYLDGADGPVEFVEGMTIPPGLHTLVPLSDRFDGCRNQATSRPVPQAQREVFTETGRAARRKAERAARRAR